MREKAIMLGIPVMPVMPGMPIIPEIPVINFAKGASRTGSRSTMGGKN
jgi:hypothetical protein